MARSVRTYHRIFREHNGDGPWPCASKPCDELVAKIGTRTRDGHVHHRDHDHKNNAPDNLAMLHNDCHAREHMLGVPKSRAHADLVNAKNRGQVRTPEQRINISAGHKHVTCQSCGRQTTTEGLTRFHQPSRDHCPTRRAA